MRDLRPTGTGPAPVVAAPPAVVTLVVTLVVALAPGTAPATAAAGDRADRGAGPRQARVLHVGPDRALTTPSQAAAVARDGDVVAIDAGTYTGDVATWTQDDLTLRGAGGPARLEADGASAQGKAIWVIAGDDTTVRRVAFSGASVPDGNGAGIRQEGTGLRVLDSVFRDNENGILTGADPGSDVVVRRSRFVGNGAGDGYTHHLYVGAVRSLDVRGCLFAGARGGHEVKSRALTTRLVANTIDDRDAAGSYSVDLPDGGDALVAGNVVVQGPRSPNRTLVSYGAESLSHPTTRLWVVHNTLVNTQATGTFVRVADGAPADAAHLRNNLLVGPGEVLAGPGDVAGTVRTRRGFVDPAAGDYRLTARSPALDAAVRVPAAYRPPQQPVRPFGLEPRPDAGRADVGALERPRPRGRR